jgi:hypothetical protein
MPSFLMNELVKQLPGVYITSMRQDGQMILIQGVAQSNQRVSEVLRNFSRARRGLRDRNSWKFKPVRSTCARAISVAGWRFQYDSSCCGLPKRKSRRGCGQESEFDHGQQERNSRSISRLWEQARSQFSDLDPKDPSLWPVFPRSLLFVGVACVVALIGWFAWLSDFKTELEGEVARRR